MTKEQERAKAVYDVMHEACERIILAHAEGVNTAGKLVKVEAIELEIMLFEFVFTGSECEAYISKMDLLLREYAKLYKIPHKSITASAMERMSEMVEEKMSETFNIKKN